jgi:hypothetical protein
MKHIEMASKGMQISFLHIASTSFHESFSQDIEQLGKSPKFDAM